jgi:hypothetical protein
MVILPNLSVNLRACLCGVINYASAQALDFLDLALDKNPHFWIGNTKWCLFWATIFYGRAPVNNSSGQHPIIRSRDPAPTGG